MSGYTIVFKIDDVQRTAEFETEQEAMSFVDKLVSLNYAVEDSTGKMFKNIFTART